MLRPTRLSSPLILALALVVLGALPAAAISLTNPGFETFTGTYASDGCRQLTPGVTTLSGWSVVGGEIAVCKVPNQYLVTAGEGANFLDIAGYLNTPGKGVSQALTGLTPGRRHVVVVRLGISNVPSCLPGSTCGGPVSVQVTVGSTSQVLSHDSAAAGVVWADKSMEFVAQVANPTLTIVGSSLPPNGAFIGLDVVSVDEVPPVPSLPVAGFVGLSVVLVAMGVVSSAVPVGTRARS